MTAVSLQRPLAEPPPAPAGVPRLLAGVNGQRSIGLAEHRATMPEPRPVAGLIDVVEAAGLRGRGGASFPAAIKLRSVLGRRQAPVVVVNASEGEPASAKDRLLVTSAPHLVLDGALHAAHATGATDVIVAIDWRNRAGVTAMEAALAARARAGEDVAAVRVAGLPSRFVAGEESAIVNFLNGGDAKPTAKPPRVTERGVGRRPTVVMNAETVAHLAQIVQWGPRWYRACGTDDEPGTMLTTISGAVTAPGAHEVEIGTPLVGAVHAAGGSSRPPAAVLVGGYYGSWLGRDDAERARLCNASLRPLDASLGCGAIVVVPDECCGLAETARLLTWMSGQTAGQCGPCVHGLAALATTMSDLALGRPGADTPARLQRWAAMVDHRGGCSFPDGAARLARTALRVFADDVHHHLRAGPCWRTASRPLLPIPSTDQGWR